MATQPTGLFIPTTQAWSTETIPMSSELKGDELRELIVRLYQNLNTMALAVNQKGTGYFPLNQSFITGDQYFPNLANGSQSYRSVVRTVVNFGALPNAGTKTVAHNIAFNSGYTLTHLYGAATDTAGLNYISLPYASNAGGSSIELRVDNANVVITTGSNRSNFNLCTVVIEYLAL